MKRRVGKYKDKIIVEGDKNEFKPHEVSIKELAGTDNMGGGVGNKLAYYKFEDVNFSKRVFELLISAGVPFANIVLIENGAEGIGYTYRIVNYIYPFSFDYSYYWGVVAIEIFEYVEGTSFSASTEHEINRNTDIYNIMRQVFSIMPDNSGNEDELNMILSNIKPITKEEFYNIKPE